LKAGSAWTGPPPGHAARTVFSTPTGRRVDPKRDYEAWRAILDAAGVSAARRQEGKIVANSAGFGGCILDLVLLQSGSVRAPVPDGAGALDSLAPS
jgi:hypothetical protein